MFRSITTPAIVLRRERLGEHHKSLLLLTADRGLLSAVAYGAWRMHSRLRTASEPFMHGLARLYHNPVKNAYKVTELEAWEGFEGLRADLDRMAAASLWAEVSQRSIAAGETTGGLYRLVLGCLRLLEGGTPPAYATAQFLWRFLELAGYRPDVTACEECGRSFGDGDGCRWVAAAGALRCDACAPAGSTSLSAGGRRYLETTAGLPLEQAADVRLDASALEGLGHALAVAIRDVLETDLRSLGALPGGRR